MPSILGASWEHAWRAWRVWARDTPGTEQGGGRAPGELAPAGWNECAQMRPVSSASAGAERWVRWVDAGQTLGSAERARGTSGAAGMLALALSLAGISPWLNATRTQGRATGPGSSQSQSAPAVARAGAPVLAASEQERLSGTAMQRLSLQRKRESSATLGHRTRRTCWTRPCFCTLAPCRWTSGPRSRLAPSS